MLNGKMQTASGNQAPRRDPLFVLDVPWIPAAYGNVQVHIRAEGHDTTPPLTRRHPEIERPRDRHPNDRSCIDMILSMPQILFTNLATASGMLNTLWLHLCSALHYHELAFDIADGLMRPVMAIPMAIGETRGATSKLLTAVSDAPAGNENKRGGARAVPAGQHSKKRGRKTKSTWSAASKPARGAWAALQ
ncbi:MAG: hypothetical protein ACP5MD_09840 [Verrucomicrobiia bacterium]